MTTSFDKAFAEARKKLGPGKTFTYKGKSYSTNTAEDAKSTGTTRPRPRPTAAPATSERPKARPARSTDATAQAPASSPRPKAAGTVRMVQAARAVEAEQKRLKEAKDGRAAILRRNQAASGDGHTVGKRRGGR
jgi:hypothetical protein